MVRVLTFLVFLFSPFINYGFTDSIKIVNTTPLYNINQTFNLSNTVQIEFELKGNKDFPNASFGFMCHFKTNNNINFIHGWYAGQSTSLSGSASKKIVVDFKLSDFGASVNGTNTLVVWPIFNQSEKGDSAKVKLLIDVSYSTKKTVWDDILIKSSSHSINLESNNISAAEINLYNLTGKKISPELFTNSRVHFNNLPVGIYIVSVNTLKGIRSGKVIVK